MEADSGVIIEKDREPVGFLSWAIHCGGVYIGAKIMMVTHWWVPREYRGGRAGYVLLRHGIKVAEETSCTHLVITLAKTSEIGENTMRRLGFDLTNSVYTRRI